MKCLCKDCVDRQIGCHVHCERYHGWLKDKAAREEKAVIRNKPAEFLIDMCRKQKRQKNLR